MKAVFVMLMLLCGLAHAQDQKSLALDPGEQVIQVAPQAPSRPVVYPGPSRGLVYPRSTYQMPAYNPSQSAYVRSVQQQGHGRRLSWF